MDGICTVMKGFSIGFQNNGGQWCLIANMIDTYGGGSCNTEIFVTLVFIRKELF